MNSERLLEVQPTRNIIGGFCVTSYDNKQHNAPGVNSDATSVLRNGINASAFASEGICTKANGFFSWDLYTIDDGKIQNEAPADVALASGNGRGLGQSVTAPVACMTCHEDGMKFLKGTDVSSGKELAGQLQ